MAEDNPVNQKLATRTLQKRGHTVFLANDGIEALEILTREAVDLVLMDVQMPRMDGLAATATIRERERIGGGRVPIIAVTAHAMAGDRERCLAAGMDGYLSKPLKADELFAAIAGIPPVKIKMPAVAIVHDRPISASQLDTPVFDLVESLGYVDGNRELLEEMIELFFVQLDRLLPQIRIAGDHRDHQTLSQQAHKLAGSMMAFGAQAAVETARRLEAVSRETELDSIDATLTELEREVTRLRKALTAYLQESNAYAS